MTRGLLPVDLLVAAFNAAMACVWATAWAGVGTPRVDVAPWLAAAHAAAAALPWVLRGMRAGPSRPHVLLREIYPLFGIAVYWAELGLLARVRPLQAHDAQVASLDRSVFGVHPHAVWGPAAPWPWFRESMFFLYFLYYVMLVLPAVVVVLRGPREATRDVVLRLAATYLTCFLFYAAYPVRGPRSLDPVPAPSHRAGLFERAVERARETGDSPGTAFPSSHVAGVVTVAWFARRWFRGWAARVLGMGALLVTLATVYTGNHFAIDAVGGAVWGAGAQALLVPALGRTGGQRDGARRRGRSPARE